MAVLAREMFADIHTQPLLRVLYILIAFLYWVVFCLSMPSLLTYIQCKSEDLAGT